MKIGEKIKRLRTAKLMTQAELAGDEITRNMLSRIENGVAQPSLSTLTYIAGRLNVSESFLLADEDDELLYVRTREMSNIKRIYRDKNYRLCREMCENVNWSDDELMLIRADCNFFVGIEDFCGGVLHSAAEHFDAALDYCKQTVYNTELIVASCETYFDYMRMISPTLYSDIEDNTDIVVLGNGFCTYSKIFCMGIERGFLDIPYLEERMNALEQDSSYEIHIKARIMMERREYAEARTLLHKLLFDESYILPEPMLYFVLGDLEICCKETGDFKGAYEYSVSKISLSQKLLG